MVACIASLMAALMYAIAASLHQTNPIRRFSFDHRHHQSARRGYHPLTSLALHSTVNISKSNHSAHRLGTRFYFLPHLAYILYFRLIQNIGSTRALTVTFLVPIFAMLWGRLFLSEPITASMVFGCCAYFTRHRLCQ